MFRNESKCCTGPLSANAELIHHTGELTSKGFEVPGGLCGYSSREGHTSGCHDAAAGFSQSSAHRHHIIHKELKAGASAGQSCREEVGAFTMLPKISFKNIYLEYFL